MTGFLIILVGVNIAPVVANQVQNVVYMNTSSTNLTANVNLTSGTGSILSLVTLFFVLSIAVAAMDIAVVGLRQSGLIA